MPYISVKQKYWAAIIAAFLWSGTSLYVAQPWIEDLAALTNVYLANFIIWGIAIIPGFMNAFLVLSLLVDRTQERSGRPRPRSGLQIQLHLWKHHYPVLKG